MPTAMLPFGVARAQSARLAPPSDGGLPFGVARARFQRFTSRRACPSRARSSCSPTPSISGKFTSPCPESPRSRGCGFGAAGSRRLSSRPIRMLWPSTAALGAQCEQHPQLCALRGVWIERLCWLWCSVGIAVRSQEVGRRCARLCVLLHLDGTWQTKHIIRYIISLTHAIPDRRLERVSQPLHERLKVKPTCAYRERAGSELTFIE